MTKGRKATFYTIVVLLNVAVILGAMKVLDYAIVLTHRGHDTDRLSDAGDVPAISTFDLYPYTGGHTQAHANRGRSVWSGDHGFFVEFDLDRPPAKAADELRLVLIGGSGAVGWGAATNFDMLYRRLEKKFNEERPCGPSVWLRVVNLAMGGSTTYQNFIALNRWAHPLAPDLILSYSGHNDFFVPLDTRSDAYLGFRTPANLVETTRFAASPGWLKDLAVLFPGLVRHTDLGFILRVLSADPTLKFGPAPSYVTRYPSGPLSRPENLGEGAAAAMAEDAMAQIASPLYRHAMASLARDFPGVPILVVSQAYMWPLDKELDERYGVLMPVPRYLEVYDRLWSDFRRDFIDTGRPDNPFHFLDFHDHYRSGLMAVFEPGDGIHLSGEKAAVLTEEVAARAFPLLCARARAEHDLAPAVRLFPDAGQPDLGRPVLARAAEGPVLLLDGIRVPVRADGRPAGTAEGIAYDEAGFRLHGWAVDPDAQGPAIEVVALAEGHLLGRTRPLVHRQDLAAWGPAFAQAGWEITVARDGALRGTLAFYALMADGTARQLDIATGFRFAADRPGPGG